MLYGELPTQSQLSAYMHRLKSLRDLPQALKRSGTLEPELSFDQQRDATDRLLAAFPAIMCYWYRFSHDSKRIDCTTDEDSIGGHFLHLLLDKPPSELHRKVMDVSLILYAEHEFNASTFTARVCARQPLAPCAARCTAAPMRPRWK